MKHEFKSSVAETLLIPLYMRAKESRQDNPILYDKAAERLADSLEYDYSQFDGAKLSEVGCVVRGWYFDRAVQRFIEAHPRPVVVNVGCGLDTRFQRIENPKAVYYDLDLPEVIALRQELIPEQPGNVYIAASLLETDWMDHLCRKHPDGEFIFIVEGVLMYFYEKQVKSFLHHVASRFGGRRTVVRRVRHDDEPARYEARFPTQTQGTNPFRVERRAYSRTMGTSLATHRASQLHEVLPSALGIFLWADIGKDDSVVL